MCDFSIALQCFGMWCLKPLNRSGSWYHWALVYHLSWVLGFDRRLSVGWGMCCDPTIVDDKVIVGQCADCDSDINQDGQCVDDGCSYSPLHCETCGCQPCDWSC